MTDAGDIVEAILREELDLEAPERNVDLIEAGLLDSLGLITLVYEIEQRCGVSIPFETLEIDDFRTVRSIASLVEAQIQEASP